MNVYLIRMCVCSTSREPEVLVLFLKCLYIYLKMWEMKDEDQLNS